MVIDAEVINGTCELPVSVPVHTYRKLVENDIGDNKSITAGPIPIVVEVHRCSLCGQGKMYSVRRNGTKCKLISRIRINPVVSRISTIHVNLETCGVREMARKWTAVDGLPQGIGLDPEGDTESRKGLCLAKGVYGIVINAVELQRAGAVMPGHPLWFPTESTVITIAGTVVNGRAGAFIKPPVN